MGAVALLPRWADLFLAPNPGPMTLTGTCTWVLRAPSQVRVGCVVIDPGPLDEGHLSRVAAAGPVALIVITHGHGDHVDGAAHLQELTGAAVTAYDPALCRGADPLREGQQLPTGDLQTRVVHLPGHTNDSVGIVVEDEVEPGIVVGDTLLGRGSTVVAHPEGRLGDYLATLERLVALDPDRRRLVLPGHGPVRAPLGELAREQLEHRRARTAQVAAAVGAGVRDPEVIVALLYPQLTGQLAGAARRTVRATLDWLAEERLSAPGD